MIKLKNPVGVDIGSHSVKVCQIRRTGDQYELERFAVVPIWPAGDRPTDLGQQRQAKIEALKRALEEGQIKSRQSISAVSGESIIVRYLQLPEMPEDELKKALQWEAEEYIPFRLSEVNLDSIILDRSGDGDQTKMDVLLVSAKKDMVADHASILSEAGLEPAIVDVDSFAFLNCFEVNHNPSREDSLALVNIGGEITNINIYNRGTSRFSRDILVGGDTITTAIASRLSCTRAEAERLKIAVGAPLSAAPAAVDATQVRPGGFFETIREAVQDKDQDPQADDSQEIKVSRAVQLVLNSLVGEVRRSVEFFENQYRRADVSRIVLGGGTAMLRNLPEYFQRELNLPVEVVDPLRNVRLASRGVNADRVQSIRHQLGVSIGLGLRGVAA